MTTTLKNVTRDVRDCAAALLSRYSSSSSSTSSSTPIHTHANSSNSCSGFDSHVAADDHARHNCHEAEVDVLLAVAAAALQKLQDYCTTTTSSSSSTNSENSDEADVDCADAVSTTRRALVHCLKSHRRRRPREEKAVADIAETAMRRVYRARLDQSDPAESNVTPSDKPACAANVDLGQYANTHAFDGNAKKLTRFARLMGGAKASVSHHVHTIQAASSECMLAINKTLENQFDSAREHKGKKGLGA